MRAALIGAIVIVWGGTAAAAEWATIVPGESTTESVKAEFGEPSRATKTKIDTYDSIDWTYEGSRAPAGMIRMVVQFGILKKGGYRPNVVRTFRLEPKPGVFTRRQIVLGWGKPDRGGTQDAVPVMIYESGLIVYFDKDIVNAISMWFTVPRPEPAPKDKP